MLDPAVAERGEKELDRLIERQAQRSGADEANGVEAMWRASERAHERKRREERRLAWYCFHLDQAERHRRTMTALVEKHEAAAARLLEEPGGGGA